MFPTSKFLRLALPVLGFGLIAAGQAGAQETPPLSLKVYNGDAGSFHVNAVVVSGKSEALVIDTGFTRADALRIAANVLDSGRRLTTILVSNADPDYYFGAETLKEIFPQAKVVTTPAVRDRIAAKLAGKLAFWGPKLGVNAPRQPIVPEAIAGNTLTVDGEKIEISGTTGPLAHRPYVWIPSLKAIAGNVAVFGKLHVWTADTQLAAEREAWLAQLDEMQARHPAVVVPGHMAPGTPLDASSIEHTRNYLQRFAHEQGQAGDAAALIAAMRSAYPEAGLGIALDIGAKVAKGEMKW